MSTPRVVITGIGLVTSLGRTLDEFGERLFAGETAVGPLEGWEIADERYRIGGQIKDFDIERELPQGDTKRLLRYSQFALVAADRAINDAALPLGELAPGRIGTSFGTAAGSLGEAVQTEIKRYLARGDRGISPMAWVELTPCACSTHVAIRYNLQGPISTHSSGCVSGIDTIAWGVQQIRKNLSDVMIVGGTDTPFFPFMWAIMTRSGILATAPEDGRGIPRPFSIDHNGIVLGEGGSALVLESEAHARLRGARVYGEVLGVANAEEARPITDLDETGHAFAVTMRKTLDDAGLPPTEIDWVCAHGTGYPVADVSESRGIEAALGSHAFSVPVSSIRGAVGQSFASGAGYQVAAACLAIRHQRVPATLNFSQPAVGCRLDYVPNVSRVARVRRVMINAAGVGGTHGGLVLSAYGNGRPPKG